MKINILGVKIDNISLESALKLIKDSIETGKQLFIVTPNPEFIVRANKDKKFCEILNKADVSLPDGIGIIAAAKFLKRPLAQRITGNDLVWELSKLAEKNSWSIYFLGGQKGIAKKTAEKLKKVYPNLIIAGAESGGEIKDTKNISSDLIKQINKARPDILFVALGHGKQERFIYYNLNKFESVKVAAGIGGVFDYISGKVKRAPNWLRKLGLEWLFRLIKEPKRWRRVCTATIVFPWLILRNKKYL